MKVEYVMTVRVIKEVNTSEHRHAESIDDAIEQDLAQYQDDPALLLIEAEHVAIEGRKLIVR